MSKFQKVFIFIAAVFFLGMASFALAALNSPLQAQTVSILPDLTIKSIVFTPEKSTYFKTDNVRIKTVIKNIGDVEAGALELNYSDRYSDGGQDKVKPLYSYSLPSITLDPGEEYVDEITFGQWPETGVNTLEVIVDYNKTMTEKDENNNTTTRSFWYDSPVPLTIYLPQGIPVEFIQGQSYVIKWDVALTVFNDKLNLDLYKGGVYNSSIVSGVLASAKSYTWTVPTTLSVGTDYAIRIYDPRYPTDFHSSAQFSIISGLPDLTVKDIQFGKDYLGPQNITNFIGAKICNEGTTTINIKDMGINQIITIFTNENNGQSMDYHGGESLLKPNSCIDNAASVAVELLGITLSGEYSINVFTDQENVINESNENNNMLRKTVNVNLDNALPVITGTSGPTSLQINETGTWTVEAQDPDGTYLSYNVDWGDTAVKSEKTTTAPSVKTSQKATFTHSYIKTGNYTITFTVSDDKGASAKSTLSVKVSEESVNNPYITSISPTSGTVGATLTINGDNLLKYSQLVLFLL